jgi:hypothetical protein
MGKFRWFMIGTGVAFMLLSSRMLYSIRKLDRLADLVGNHDYTVSLKERENFKSIMKESNEVYFPYVLNNKEHNRRAAVYVQGIEKPYLHVHEAQLSELEFRLYENNQLVDPVNKVGLIRVKRTPLHSHDEEVFSDNTEPVEYYRLTQSGLLEQGLSDAVIRNLRILFTQVKYEKPRINSKG